MVQALVQHLNNGDFRFYGHKKMKKKIILFNQLPESLLAPLRQDFDLEIFASPQDRKSSAFSQAIKNVHGMIGAFMPVDKDLLSQAQNLEVISTITVGYDQFDIPYLSQRGIMLTNTPDVLTETTADLGFLLMFAAARRLKEMSDLIYQGQWQESVASHYYGVDIHRKKLGIIGFGRIGQTIAKRGHFGFEMEILYYNRHRKPEEAQYQAKFCELDELLATADFICVTVPLTKETKGLIGEREFNLMHKEAIFVNISRGQVVNENALIKALQTHKIRAAGLDVFAKEPLPLDSPLLKLPNVTLTPHIGSATTETRTNMAKLAISNLVAGLSGKRPPSLVNTEVWKG